MCTVTMRVSYALSVRQTHPRIMNTRTPFSARMYTYLHTQLAHITAGTYHQRGRQKGEVIEENRFHPKFGKIDWDNRWNQTAYVLDKEDKYGDVILQSGVYATNRYCRPGHVGVLCGACQRNWFFSGGRGVCLN